MTNILIVVTPSELYIKETRSALQFASRVKLVKTSANVNGVMDYRLLIRRLQKELKDTRNGRLGEGTMEQMKALQEKATSAEFANRKAEEDLKRMKNLVLMGGGALAGTSSFHRSAMMNSSSYDSLFVYTDDEGTVKTGAEKYLICAWKRKNSKRRYSAGVINEIEAGHSQLASFASPARRGNVTKPQAQTEIKPKKRAKPTMHLGATTEVDSGLFRDALAYKSAQMATMKNKLKKAEQAARGKKAMFCMSQEDLQSQVCSLASDKEFAIMESNVAMDEKDKVIATYLEKIKKMLEERKGHASTVEQLQGSVKSLQGQLETNNAEHENAIKMMNEPHCCQGADMASEKKQVEKKLQFVEAELACSRKTIEGLEKNATDLESCKRQKDALRAEIEKAEEIIATLRAEKTEASANANNTTSDNGTCDCSEAATDLVNSGTAPESRTAAGELLEDSFHENLEESLRNDQESRFDHQVDDEQLDDTVGLRHDNTPTGPMQPSEQRYSSAGCLNNPKEPSIDSSDQSLPSSNDNDDLSMRAFSNCHTNDSLGELEQLDESMIEHPKEDDLSGKKCLDQDESSLASSSCSSYSGLLGYLPFIIGSTSRFRSDW